jgi:8-oxo-dGTP pyrophosphatase MutT (NUDIX family)
MILRAQENRTELLVIERASSRNDPWSGHLAFPGGRRSPGDETLLATAERETLEEVGLDLHDCGNVLGELSHVVVPRVVGFAVAPFVFELHETPPLRLAPAEVRRHFWVPLAPLFDGERETTYEFQRDGTRFEMPGYRVEDRVLWGMSYQMLRSLFAAVGGG